MSLLDEHKIMRRVAGHHNYRMDGLTDLLVRAQGMSVLDLGCNRGMAGYDFANHGARLVHGCDLDSDAVFVARSVFADMRNVESVHICADLTKGPDALKPLGERHYDTILMLATYHKIKRVMKPGDLSSLIKHLGQRAIKYFAWRATSDKPIENEAEMGQLDHDLGPVGLKRVHTSTMSLELGIAAIWRRV